MLIYEHNKIKILLCLSKFYVIIMSNKGFTPHLPENSLRWALFHMVALYGFNLTLLILVIRNSFLTQIFLRSFHFLWLLRISLAVIPNPYYLLHCHLLQSNQNFSNESSIVSLNPIGCSQWDFLPNGISYALIYNHTEIPWIPHQSFTEIRFSLIRRIF